MQVIVELQNQKFNWSLIRTFVIGNDKATHYQQVQSQISFLFQNTDLVYSRTKTGFKKKIANWFQYIHINSSKHLTIQEAHYLICMFLLLQVQVLIGWGVAQRHQATKGIYYKNANVKTTAPQHSAQINGSKLKREENQPLSESSTKVARYLQFLLS